MLRIESINVHYDQVEVLMLVSMVVEQASTVTLVGANGAGKSTLLRTISGLMKPSSGKIWLLDKRIDGSPPQDIVAQGISQVPEGRRLFPYMSVQENLKMGGFLRKDDLVQDLTKIYEQFPKLKERRKQYAGTLSGGEQQMLAIARSLMAKPTLLLMDEPSLGLAPLMVTMIGQIISDIQKDGIGILLVEQNAKMALKVAQRGYVLEKGRVVLEGNSDDLAKGQQVKKAYLGLGIHE